MYLNIYYVTFITHYPNPVTIGITGFHNLVDKMKILSNVFQYDYAHYTLIYIGYCIYIQLSMTNPIGKIGC